MKICASPNFTPFKARLAKYLEIKHKASIKNKEDEEKSKEALERISKILPDYCIKTGPYNHNLALKLESIKKSPGHTIYLYETDNKKIPDIDYVEIDKIDKLAKILEDRYGDTTPIGDCKVEILDKNILDNPHAMSIMKILEEEALPILEKIKLLIKPYSVKIEHAAENEGKTIKLAHLGNETFDTYEPATVKENIKITIKTKDKADNIASYHTYFYLPEDIHEQDDHYLWANKIKNSIKDVIIKQKNDCLGTRSY